MLLIFTNKKMSVFKFCFCSNEMLYYNRYTVYPQPLCIEIAEERFIVILEFVPSVNQWQCLRDDCGWKWLISSTDKQKWYKWSWGHFARLYLCLLGDIYICVCVCVCYSMCCLSQWRLLPFGLLMALMSLQHESLNTFIIPRLPVSRWMLFRPWSCTHKAYSRFLSVFHKEYTHFYTHAQIHCAIMQARVKAWFSSFFPLFFWCNKHQGWNLPYSTADYLSDCEIKAV